MNMEIRPERPEDVASIHRVNELAFETPAEADLVDALRKGGWRGLIRYRPEFASV